MDNYIDRRKLLCSFAQNYKEKKRVKIEEEDNSFLLLFEDQVTETIGTFLINNTLTKGGVRETRNESR